MLVKSKNGGKWLILLVGSALATLVSIFALFEFLFDVEILGRHFATPIIGLVISILLALYCMRIMTVILTKRLHKNYFDRFEHCDVTGAFVETTARYYSPKKHIKHAVLLLHGFTTSPQDFGGLLEKLEAERITYVAPVLPGFGVKNLKMLEHVTYQDWCRHAIEEYQRLSQYAEKITVVGQSMGSLLACYIAKHYKVENLVLSSPAFYLKNDGEQRFVRLVENKIGLKFLKMCLPMIPKVSEKYEDASVQGNFSYMSVPINAIHQILNFQTASRDLRGLQFNKLYLILGEQDKLVDVQRSVSLFNNYGYSFETCNLANTAHQPWCDRDSVAVVDWLIEKIDAQLASSGCLNTVTI